MSDTNYEVKHVDEKSIQAEIKNQLSQMSEPNLIALWNDYSEKNDYHEQKVAPIDWRNLVDLYGAEKIIQQIFDQEVKKTDKYYSFDGLGNLQTFKSINDENSPIDLNEIANSIVNNLGEKVDRHFEYEEDCKYLTYDKKSDDGTKLMIIETTNGGLYYDLESKLDDAVGINFAQDFVRNDMLYDVFENLEEVKPEQTNTKRMKP